MPSSAFTLFNQRRIPEVVDISGIFREINNRPGPNTNYSLLNGALVLLVSSWEVYCEEVCRQAAGRIRDRATLSFATLPDRLKRDLIVYAGSTYKGKQDPLRERVAQLPDDGWKQLVVDRLEEYIRDFNTPKFTRQRGKDLNGLFRHVLGNNMSTSISELLEEPEFCATLDEIVTLRGEIAHTGDAAPQNRLSADMLEAHAQSFGEAAAAIEAIFHSEFRTHLGFVPWQVTAPIRANLREAAQGKL